MVIGSPSVGPLSNTAPSIYNSAPLLVAQSLDWLTCSIADELPDDRLLELVRLVDTSEARCLESSYTFFGVPLMLSRGSGACLIKLHVKDWFDVRIMASGSVMPSQVTIYSRPFWEYGNEACISALQGFVDTLWCKVGVRLAPARVDLASDVTGFPVAQFDSREGTRARFVTRLRDLDSKGKAETETLYLGGGGDVSVKVYNKSLECKVKGKDYYQPTWRANGWQGEEVTRVEFKLLTNFFRTWHLQDGGVYWPVGDVWQLVEQLPAIHQYLTRSHTRLVTLDQLEANRTRLDLDPVWLLVASPWRGDICEAPGSRFRRYSNDRRKLEKLCAGAFISYVSLIDCGADYSPDELARGFLAMLGRVQSDKGKSWRELVVDRQALLLGRAA